MPICTWPASPVTLVARGVHLDAIRANGLILDTADGRRIVPATAAGSAAEVEWTDDTVVLLSVKSQQTAAALADLAEHAPESTPIVSVQNGVANEAAILRRFANVYAACVITPAMHLEPGVVVQGSAGAPAILDIGAYPSGIDATASAVAADLQTATIISEQRPDIVAWRYRKLIHNLVNGIDAVFVQNDAANELARRARREGEGALAAAGIAVVSAEHARQRRADHVPLRGGTYAGSSTWQSVSRGVGDVEIDFLSGEIVLVGRLHGHRTPVNEAVQRVVNRVVREHGAPRSIDASDLLATLPAAGA